MVTGIAVGQVLLLGRSSRVTINFAILKLEMRLQGIDYIVSDC